jgi:penicillin-binding protein 1A
METILVKIFATALALSQVTTTPDTVKTQFDRVQDQEQVAQLLGAGCTHVRKAFDIEDINLEDLIATALDDPQAVDENKVFRGINFADLQMAYREFCKNEKIVVSAVDLRDVIDFYNKAAAGLPDHTKLKGLRLPGARTTRRANTSACRLDGWFLGHGAGSSRAGATPNVKLTLHLDHSGG